MMQTLTPLAARLTQAIGWSLIHSLWQGALVCLVLAAIFRFVPGITARLKHGCALMGLLLLSLWTVNTAVSHWQQLSTIAVRVVPSNSAPGYVIEVPPPTPVLTIESPAVPILQSMMPWLMLVYCLGLLIMLTRLGTALRHLQLLRHDSITEPGETLTQTLHSLQLQLGISRDILLRLSTRVAVPVVIGALRPMILLPTTMVEQLRPQELEAILLHELAHISRADFLINILQSCIETLLFFNPFVWRLSGIIRKEREHCCDDLVIACTDQPLIYAQALSSLARQNQSAPSIALAATGHQPLLLNRIKRILEMKNHPLRYGQIIAACTLAALIISVSIVCFSPSLAQRRDQAPKAKEGGKHAADSTRISTRIVIVDSNGVRKEYRSAEALPPRVRKQLRQGLKSLEQADGQLKKAEIVLRQGRGKAAIPAVPSLEREMPEPPEAPEAPEAPEPGERIIAVVPPYAPMVSWNDISKQVDSAMARVDWKSIDRNIQKSIIISQRSLDDPKLKANIRRSLAAASKQAAMGMQEREQLLAESRREIDAARREMQQARREMEQARKEMQQAKAEFERQKEAFQRQQR